MPMTSWSGNLSQTYIMAVFQGFWQVCFYSLCWYLNKRRVLGSSLALLSGAYMRGPRSSVQNSLRLTHQNINGFIKEQWGCKNQWPMTQFWGSTRCHILERICHSLTFHQQQKNKSPQSGVNELKRTKWWSLSCCAIILISLCSCSPFIISAWTQNKNMTDLILNASVNSLGPGTIAVFNEMLNYVKLYEGNHSSTAGGL